MIRIAHFHYHTNKNVNIGDEAHVLAIQDTLRSQMGEVEIINYPISFLCRYQLPPTIWLGRRLPLFFHNTARILRGKPYSQLLKEIDEADLVVIGGGGVYMDHLLPFNIPLLQSITTPIVVFGAGYNRNFGSAEFTTHQLESIKVLGKKASLQSVRDTNTQAFLAKQGIKTELVGDPALFLQKAPTTIKPTGKTLIGVNIAAHGWKQQSQFETILLDSFSTMIQTLERRYNIAFHYFIHHPGEHALIEKLRQKGIVFASVIDTSAKETKAEYAAMRCTVSMMLHSTILAFGEGKPSVCIGYDDKNKSFMDLTNQANRYIRVDEVTPKILTQKVEALIKNLDISTAEVQKKYSNLKSVYDDFSSRVEQIVHK